MYFLLMAESSLAAKARLEYLESGRNMSQGQILIQIVFKISYLMPVELPQSTPKKVPHQKARNLVAAVFSKWVARYSHGVLAATMLAVALESGTKKMADVY